MPAGKLYLMEQCKRYFIFYNVYFKLYFISTAVMRNNNYSYMWRNKTKRVTVWAVCYHTGSVTITTLDRKQYIFACWFNYSKTYTQCTATFVNPVKLTICRLEQKKVLITLYIYIYIWQKCYKSFFGSPYHSNGTIIHLNVALNTGTGGVCKSASNWSLFKPKTLSTFKITQN